MYLSALRFDRTGYNDTDMRRTGDQALCNAKEIWLACTLARVDVFRIVLKVFDI